MGNNLIWKPINRPEFGLMNGISNLIHQLEVDKDNLLTTVRLGSTLVLTCDFSGQHNNLYDCYSFLLADLDYLWLWDNMRTSLREKHLPNKRRMSFKNLNDSHRQNALIPFLRAANCIPGLLVSFLIDKEIESLFEVEGKLDISSELYQNYRHWKPHVFEKVLRVANFGAILIACMSAPNQNILWFTDEDDIAPNKNRIIEICDLLAHHCNHYLSHNLGHFKFGTAQSDDGTRFLEDLIAIPDLIAGTLTEIGTIFSEQRNVSGKKNYFNELEIKGKTELIMKWFVEPTHTLKRLIVRLEKNQEGKIVQRCTRFECGQHNPAFLWHEEFINIIRGN